MAKYYELAEKLSEKYSPEQMCEIIATASIERINQMIEKYEI